MKVIRLVCGSLQANNYLVLNDEETGAVLIDCSGDGSQIILEAEKAGVSIEAILLTHGHFDHIEAVDTVSERFRCPIYIHTFDCSLLRYPDRNLSLRIKRESLVVETEPVLFQDCDVIEAAGMKFEVIHTPGHTSGSVCFHLDDVVFTGDTLFRESIGNEYPPYGDAVVEIYSIQTRLFTYINNHLCYPGHGETTDLEYEKNNNSFCRL